MSIDKRNLQPFQRYLLKFIGDDMDEDTIVTLECTFHRYFDTSLFTSYGEYNHLPPLPPELNPIYYINEISGYPYLHDLDFTDKYYPYRHIVFDGMINEGSNYYFSNYRTVNPNDLMIGLFQVNKIRHSNQWITEDHDAIHNIVIANEDPIDSDTFIWVYLDYVYEIKELVQDKQIANTIHKFAYNSRRDNPYIDFKSNKPPIPEDVLKYNVYPWLGLNTNHITTLKPRSKSRGRSIVRGIKRRTLNRNNNARGRDVTIKYTNNSIRPKKTRKLRKKQKSKRKSI